MSFVNGARFFSGLTPTTLWYKFEFINKPDTLDN